MPSKTISAAAKRACVVRVAAARKRGENVVDAEAARLKVSPQAVRNWCRDAGVDLKGEIAPPAQPAAGGAASAPPPASPAPADPAAADALKDAHALAGTSPAAPAAAPSPSAPITPAEVEKAYQEASAEDKAFVVDTMEDFKRMLVGFTGPVFFKVPQEDPVLVKISGFGPMTRNVLRANAGTIAPDMRSTIARGWDIVIGAVLLDLAYTSACLMERRKDLKPARAAAEEVEEEPAPRVPAQEAPAPAPKADAGGVWKPGDGPPPPPPAGAVVPR